MSEENENVEKLEVTIKDDDSEELRKIKTEVRKEQEKAEEYRSKLDIISEQDINRKLDELGIDNEDQRKEFMANPERLVGYEKGLEDAKKQAKLNERKENAGQSGGASLAGQYMDTKGLLKQEF